MAFAGLLRRRPPCTNSPKRCSSGSRGPAAKTTIRPCRSAAQNCNQQSGGKSASLKNAVQLKPSAGGEQALSRAWFALAQVLEESDSKAALNAYQKSAGLDPKNSDAILGSGKMLEKNGSLAVAEQQYLLAANMN